MPEEPQSPQFNKFPQSRTVDEGSPFKATCALDDVETGRSYISFYSFTSMLVLLSPRSKDFKRTLCSFISFASFLILLLALLNLAQEFFTLINIFIITTKKLKLWIFHEIIS